MLKETGKVVAIESDGLWVETLKNSSCATCAAKSGCGQKMLAGFAAPSNMTFIKAFFTDASGTHIWAVGDRAVLGVEEGALVKAALIAYGLPLIFMLVGLLAGSHVIDSVSRDLGSLIGALLGLIVGGIVVKLHQRRIPTDKSIYHAHVLGRVLAEDPYE